MLTYADVCRRMPTYADVCRRMPTYADVCRRMMTCAPQVVNKTGGTAGGKPAIGGGGKGDARLASTKVQILTQLLVQTHKY
jgi:hypothetical protein